MAQIKRLEQRQRKQITGRQLSALLRKSKNIKTAKQFLEEHPFEVIDHIGQLAQNGNTEAKILLNQLAKSHNTEIQYNAKQQIGFLRWLLKK